MHIDIPEAVNSPVCNKINRELGPFLSSKLHYRQSAVVRLLISLSGVGNFAKIFTIYGGVIVSVFLFAVLVREKNWLLLGAITAATILLSIIKKQQHFADVVSKADFYPSVLNSAFYIGSLFFANKVFEAVGNIQNGFMLAYCIFVPAIFLLGLAVFTLTQLEQKKPQQAINSYEYLIYGSFLLGMAFMLVVLRDNHSPYSFDNATLISKIFFVGSNLTNVILSFTKKRLQIVR